MDLSKVENKKVYKIISIPDVDVLESLGIREGDTVTKKHTYAFGGPTVVKIDDREVAMGGKVASRVIVEEVKNVK